MLGGLWDHAGIEKVCVCTLVKVILFFTHVRRLDRGRGEQENFRRNNMKQYSGLVVRHNWKTFALKEIKAKQNRSKQMKIAFAFIKYFSPKHSTRFFFFSFPPNISLVGFYQFYFAKPLHPNISMHLLHIVHYTFLKESLFNNQELLQLVIISYILVTLMSDSRVIL